MDKLAQVSNGNTHTHTRTNCPPTFSVALVIKSILVRINVFWTCKQMAPAAAPEKQFVI